MAYRKLDVDGVEYEYVVGSTHVKIRGMQAVLKDQVGTPVPSKYDRGPLEYKVTPEAVRAYIRTQQ